LAIRRQTAAQEERFTQAVTEEIVLRMARHAHEVTGMSKLVEISFHPSAPSYWVKARPARDKESYFHQY